VFGLVKVSENNKHKMHKYVCVAVYKVAATGLSISMYPTTQPHSIVALPFCVFICLLAAIISQCRIAPVGQKRPSNFPPYFAMRGFWRAGSVEGLIKVFKSGEPDVVSLLIYGRTQPKTHYKGFAGEGVGINVGTQQETGMLSRISIEYCSSPKIPIA